MATYTRYTTRYTRYTSYTRYTNSEALCAAGSWLQIDVVRTNGWQAEPSPCPNRREESTNLPPDTDGDSNEQRHANCKLSVAHEHDATRTATCTSTVVQHGL